MVMTNNWVLTKLLTKKATTYTYIPTFVNPVTALGDREFFQRCLQGFVSTQFKMQFHSCIQQFD